MCVALGMKPGKVNPTPEIPHGIRYNLTLHNNYNRRIMGFDNAHAIKTRKSRGYKGRIITYDHIQQTPIDKGTPYEFTSAEQLLHDFLQRVNNILNNLDQ